MLQAVLLVAWCFLGHVQFSRSGIILQDLGLEDQVRSYLQDLLAEDEEFKYGDKEVNPDSFGNPIIFSKLNGGAGSTSFYKPLKRNPNLAFGGRGLWGSAGSGTMPQAIWYKFNHPVKVEQFSFRSRRKNHKHFKDDGPSSYIFFGSTNPDCSDESSWVVLYEDNSETPFSKDKAIRFGTVKDTNFYTCYGFNIINVPGRPNGKKYAVVRDVNFYGDEGGNPPDVEEAAATEEFIAAEEEGINPPQEVEEVGGMEEFPPAEEGGNPPEVEEVEVGAMDEFLTAEEVETSPYLEGDEVGAVEEFTEAEEGRNPTQLEGEEYQVGAIEEFTAADENPEQRSYYSAGKAAQGMWNPAGNAA